MNLAAAIQLIALLADKINTAIAIGRTSLSQDDMDMIAAHQMQSDAEYDKRLAEAKARIAARENQP